MTRRPAPPTGTPADYHRLSLVAKQAHSLEQVHEPPVRCPSCGTGTLPADLIGHAARCQGPPPPGPRSRWLSWREALELGAPAASLSRWTRQGLIRTRGPNRDRLFLHRDVVLVLVRQRLWRRRR